MQSIRLLQMTHVELEQFIDGEIEKNPLLERIEAVNDDFSGVETPEQSSESDSGDAATPTEPSGDDADWFEKTARASDGESIASTFDAPLENFFPDDSGPRDVIGSDLAAQWKSSAGDGYASGQGYDLEQVTAGQISLGEQVQAQIGLAFSSATDRFIAAELAGGLDENGYLRTDLAETAEKLGVLPSAIEGVLNILKTFDPPGLFGHDLRECLAIQLRLKDRYDPAMQALVHNLDLLAKRDFQALQRLCGVDQADLVDMLAEIRHLDPKPGAKFEVSVTNTIVPDVIVSAARAGGWDLELNPAAMPRLLVNNEYYAHVSLSATVDEKSFLSDCLQTAGWLTRSLDQRARTILKVAQEIVRQQDGFLHHGIAELKPLNLRNVAEAIGMHESTISRVTANKFMATPRGVFELRYFFSAALAASGGGDAHSAEAVRHKIRQLIEAEAPGAVLSDDALVEALKTSGVDIARRTVAKYREAMNIASSTQRRREKRAISAGA